MLPPLPPVLPHLPLCTRTGLPQGEGLLKMTVKQIVVVSWCMWPPQKIKLRHRQGKTTRTLPHPATSEDATVTASQPVPYLNVRDISLDYREN
ncbi:hypothetical protein O3P69_017868 [Scylla paramamosain]|uniref:Uncharacterized protein n=1 Tax=Scylla paramamosain TaxID=85552 RepID=A0AAW0TG48_SCYPA